MDGVSVGAGSACAKDEWTESPVTKEASKKVATTHRRGIGNLCPSKSIPKDESHYITDSMPVDRVECA